MAVTGRDVGQFLCQGGALEVVECDAVNGFVNRILARPCYRRNREYILEVTKDVVILRNSVLFVIENEVGLVVVCRRVGSGAILGLHDDKRITLGTVRAFIQVVRAAWRDP